MQRRLIHVLTAGTVATLLALTGTLPAHAATETASGSKTCPVGQVVYVRADLQNPATMKFRQSGALVYTSPTSLIHYYRYSSRSVSWTIESAGNILTQSDGCTTGGISRIGETPLSEEQP
ncbi:hypothetical protein GCM10009796_23480 [Microbacterium koreense]